MKSISISTVRTIIATLCASASLVFAGNTDAATVPPANFVYTGSTQNHEIGTTGLYRITVFGANGGAAGNVLGGSGAFAQGTYFFNEGISLDIVVGGGGGNDINGGDGGGGSLVTRSNGDVLLVVAGGGGGGGSAGLGGGGQSSGGDAEGAIFDGGDGGAVTVSDGGMSYVSADALGPQVIAGVDGGSISGNGFVNISYIAEVPEPSSVALLGLGGLMIMCRKRRDR